MIETNCYQLKKKITQETQMELVVISNNLVARLTEMKQAMQNSWLFLHKLTAEQVMVRDQMYRQMLGTPAPRILHEDNDQTIII